MSATWFVIPSARPAAECEPVFQKWSERGYRIAIQRDPGQRFDSQYVDVMIERPYRGYAESVNYLAKLMLADRSVDWIVCAGDDTLPDPSRWANEIAAQCTAYFDVKDRIAYAREQAGEFDLECSQEEHEARILQYVLSDKAVKSQKLHRISRRSTFGVVQPTGDRWTDAMGPIIDRIAGSPWLGRDWCLRANQGKGPLWHEYFHNWADEELMLVAQKLGCFWQRQDLTHYHDHALRKPGGDWREHQKGFSADYLKFQPLFERRKAQGFPGSDPL